MYINLSRKNSSKSVTFKLCNNHNFFCNNITYNAFVYMFYVDVFSFISEERQDEIYYDKIDNKLTHSDKYQIVLDEAFDNLSKALLTIFSEIELDEISISDNTEPETTLITIPLDFDVQVIISEKPYTPAVNEKE